MDIKSNTSSIASKLSECVWFQYKLAIQNQRKDFLGMQCMKIAVKGHSSKNIFRKNS